MMKMYFNPVIMVFSLLLICSSAICQTYPIVDTDVSDFYNNSAIIAAPTIGQAFYGQDATYNGNQPSYTDNGDGTITDNVTGLMWQQDMGSKLNYDDALTKANNLTLGGHTDWRIPTIKELYSLILFTGSVMGQSSIDMFINTNYFTHPLGDTNIGEREIDAQTLSSTHYVGLTMFADSTVFGVNFVDGRIKGYPKYQPPLGVVQKTYYFRLVRANTAYGINSFIDNNDGTITDNATGLMWQQADDGNTRDWENSISYCENLTFATQNDWRMPNTKELQSIVDYSRAPDYTNSPAIDPLFSATSFNDPDGNAGQYGHYWTGTGHLDGVNPYSSAAYIAFGEAQGEMNGNLMDVHGAGAQRSDPKTGNPADYPQYFGPQGDVRYVFNYTRCVRDASCSTGSFPDADGDGVCDANDQCPGQDDALIGTTCDDGDACTTGDVYDSNCGCAGTFQDADGDGVCDANDICPGGDDLVDNNGNGTPDDCETGCTYAQIDFNNFNSNWGIWNKGGSDCRRSARDAVYSNGGIGRSVRLRDNTSSSMTTTDNLDLNAYDELTINFNYYTRSMDNSSEDFWLQVSTNGGLSFTTVEEWNRNDEFVNNQRYFESVVVTGPFSSTTQLRFRCDASGNSDWVYIDDVEITGCSNNATRNNANGANGILDQPKEESIIENAESLTIDVYPNPFTDHLNIVISEIEHYEQAYLQIYDISGNLVYDQKYQDQRFIYIKDLKVSAGQYIIKMTVDDKVITKSLIRIK